MSGYTVETWLKHWLDVFALHSIKQSTFATYDYYINSHIVPKIGHILLESLTVEKLQEFYNDKFKSGNLKTGKGLSPKTIRNIHLMLHEALDYACGLDVLQKNVSEYTRLPKMYKKQIKVLTENQQRKLTELCKNEYSGFGIYLTLATGIRLGELLGLQWQNVNFEDGIITISQTLNRIPNYDKSEAKTSLVIGTPKSQKSNRIIPLNSEVLRVMKKHYEERKDISDFVISNENGLPIEPRTYQDNFKRYLKRAGIEDITFHCLRHTFATRALENDIPAKVVSELLGHSSISITLDLYSHVFLEPKRKAMEKLSYLSV